METSDLWPGNVSAGTPEAPMPRREQLRCEEGDTQQAISHFFGGGVRIVSRDTERQPVQ